MATRKRQALVNATKAFAQENTAQSWRELLVTLALYASAMTALAVARGAFVKAPLALFAGLLLMRLFVFMHDAAHGAIFRRSRAGRILTRAMGLFVFVTPRAWDDIHNHHHKHIGRPFTDDIAKATDADLADRVLSLDQWATLDAKTRLRVRLVRHPVVVFGAIIGAFLLGHCIGPFVRDPRRYWHGPLAFVAWIAALVTVAQLTSLSDAFFLLVLPQSLSAAIGGYIFYAQHNFESLQLVRAEDWHPIDAALQSSSFFRMSPLMHWFTGNIGYHHVHHHHPKIPFYRLPEVMTAIEELQTPHTTSWAPREVLRTLHCSVWDPREQRMISFAEADRRTRAALACV